MSCVALLGAVVTLAFLSHRDELQAYAMRELRVEQQRAASTLQWLRRDEDFRRAVLRTADAISVAVVDAVSDQALRGQLVNWRIERIVSNRTPMDSVSGSLRLVADFAVDHGARFLAELAALERALGPRPVLTTACRVERDSVTRPSDTSSAGIVARCTLDWPWWR